MFQKLTNARALIRAIGITSAIMVVVAGVTFASLQSQAAVLRGNTIQTAVADLKLSSDGTNWSSQLDGFAFGNLIPGGQPSPMNGYPIKIKNNGSTALSVTLSIAKPITNPDNVNLNNVHVILTPTGGGPDFTATLQELLSSNVNNGLPITQAARVVNGQMIGYTMRISMDADALNGPGASISDLDFSFGAQAVN